MNISLNRNHLGAEGEAPEIRPTPLWWARTPAGWLYFCRELTGLGIALYMAVFVGALFDDPTGAFVQTSWFWWISVIGLVSALFHSVTWLAVSLKVTPFELPRWAQRVGFLVLILIGLGLSYFLMQSMYLWP